MRLREDLELAEYAQSKEWKIELHRDDEQFERTDLKGPHWPNHSLSFKKGKKFVWMASANKGWACAELKDGRYQNHRWNNALKELLDAES